MVMNGKKVNCEMAFSHLVNEVRNGVMASVHSHYPSMEWEDVEDIFQDACCVMWGKWQDGNIEWKKEGFAKMMYVICRNLASHNVRKQKDASLDESHLQIAETHDEVGEERLMLLYMVMQQASKKDQELMEMYYMKDWSLKKIAEVMGYKNDKVAKNMKCKAMKRLKDACMKAMQTDPAMQGSQTATPTSADSTLSHTYYIEEKAA